MRTSASQPDQTRPHRLPVNPRRNHVEAGQRKRVKTACNSCNTRRVRCSGDHPCANCKTANRECVYPPADKKVSIPQSEHEELRVTRAALERCLEKAIPDEVLRQTLLREARQAEEAALAAANAIKDEEPHATSPTPSSSTMALSPPQDTTFQGQYEYYGPPHRQNGRIDAAATEGSLLQDRDGTKRWLGGTSGATFLDHLKKFMSTLKSSLGYVDSHTGHSPGSKFLASRGKYQTSDSRILSLPASDNVQVFAPQMSWNDAAVALAKVEVLLQGSATSPICGGIHYFGDFSPQNWAKIQNDPTRAREQAFYEAAFALGTVYSLTAANSRRDGYLGETFFAKARLILGDSNDISRYSLRDVPTLALMAMYMAEMNRRDNSYMYLSSAMTICCMFGGLNDRLGNEKDVRMVWTLFCMTRDASYVMGRPPLYPEEAFKLPSPSFHPGLPPPDGLLAHIELSKIAGYIVTVTYQTAARKGEDDFPDTVARVVKAKEKLDDWHRNLEKEEPHLFIPKELPPEVMGSTPGLPMDRALCMLHMKWSQLRILALRPLFFMAVKASVGGDFINEPLDMFDHDIDVELLTECSNAARRNLRLGRHINDNFVDNNQDPSRPLGKFVMMDLHHIFNAAVILLLHQMVYSNVVNTDTIGILAAREIFESEARAECASPGSKSTAGSGSNNNSQGGMATGYASDCLGVLNDLAALVAYIRQLRFKGSSYINTGVNIGFGSPIASTHAMGTGTVASEGRSGILSSSSQPHYTNQGTSSLTSNLPLSEEQLAANLGLENPYGPSEAWLLDHMADGGEPYTNQKEMERWVQECREGLSGPFLRFTGL